MPWYSSCMTLKKSSHNMCPASSMKWQTDFQEWRSLVHPQLLPPQLQDAKRRVTPKREDAFFRSWTAAVGPSSNFVSVRRKMFHILRSSMRQCAETPSCVRKRPLLSHLSRRLNFYFVNLWLGVAVSFCVPCKQFLRCWFPLFQHQMQVPASP